MEPGGIHVNSISLPMGTLSLLSISEAPVDMVVHSKNYQWETGMEARFETAMQQHNSSVRNRSPQTKSVSTEDHGVDS